MSLRTGVVTRTPPATRAEWDDRVRKVDVLGHDVVLIPDHLGQWPPLSPLVAAASVSDRLRFGVQVLNNEFWNPMLLAREAAAADVGRAGRAHRPRPRPRRRPARRHRAVGPGPARGGHARAAGGGRAVGGR